MLDMYPDSNEGMVMKLGWARGLKRNSKKPTQIRVNLFQNVRFKFDMIWCVLWSLVK